jgi:hypothetical protein
MFPLTLAAVTLLYQMKNIIYILLLVFATLFISSALPAQCSVCTKTASQLGEKPAQGMNAAILYLMMTPFAIVGFIGYRWWKGNKKLVEEEILSQQPAK